MNLAWWLETGSWNYPDKTAVINPDGSEVTYAELNRLSNRYGNLLREHYGIRDDDIVATLAGENHRHIALMFAVWKVGAVFSPLNRTQKFPKFVHDLGVTKAKLLVVDSRFLEVAHDLLKEGAVPQAATLGAADPQLPDLASQAAESSDRLRVAERAHADLAIINFTTGTTGPSKGAMLPHGQLITSYLGGVHLCGMKSSDVGLCPLYLFHAGGLSIILTTLVAHSTIVLMGEPWNSDRAIDLLEKHRPDWLFLMVPVMTRDLARNPRFAKLDCSNLKLHLAGEPVSPEVQKMWEERGARTLILYGMTESMAVCVTGSSFFYGDDARVPKGSVGAPIREFGRLKLIDPISGQEITEAGVQGEICFKGDVLTPGYYNNLERTRESIDEDGWFHTFDLGIRDENGFYKVWGRTDDIISSGGEKLSLIEVETALLKAPFVQDAACLGVRHERFGQSPAALVVTRTEMEEEEMARRLDQFVREQLESWKRPRLYARVEQIPRSLAKRSKIWPQMRALLEGVELTDDTPNTLTAYRARYPSGRP